MPWPARMLLGVTEPVLNTLESLSLCKIQQPASQQPDLATPRWPGRTTFWLKHRQGDRAQSMEAFKGLRLLGIQMVASEIIAGQRDCL